MEYHLPLKAVVAHTLFSTNNFALQSIYTLKEYNNKQAIHKHKAYKSKQAYKTN